MMLTFLFHQFCDLLIDSFEPFCHIVIGTFFGQSQILVQLGVLLFY